MKKLKVLGICLIVIVCLFTLTGCSIENFNIVDNSVLENEVKSIESNYNDIEKNKNEIKEISKTQIEQKENKNEIKETSKTQTKEEVSKEKVEKNNNATKNSNSKSNNETKQDSSKNKTNLVWIPKSGKKYHNKSSCSNMKNPSQVTQSIAEARGYTPCKKCY